MDNPLVNLKKFKKNRISVDVERVLNDLNIPFKPTSRDFVIRCISGLHVDLNPSLRIDKSKGIFKCWSCGFTGNMVVLISKFLGVSFKESEKRLTDSGHGKAIVKDAYFKGLEVRKKGLKKDRDEDVRITLPDTFLRIDSGHKMFLDYLYDRQLTYEMVKNFDIRCCLIGHYNYRIVVPVYKEDKTVNFVARDILNKEQRFERGVDEYRKYLYPKGSHIARYLFNHDNLDVSKDLYVVEGVFDFFALWSQGYHNSTCVFGLHISDEQEKMLKRFKRIVVLPDQKGGGATTLTQNIQEILGAICDIKEVVLPAGTDANDIRDLKPYIDVAIEVKIEPRVVVNAVGAVGKKEFLIKKNKI